MSAHLSPGDVIPGTRYRVLSRVGEGAMGAIYAALHIDLEKRVALKTLLPEIAQVPEAVERFRQEARAASKIGSPYICDVTDFGALPDGQVYFVMEYLEGQSLAQLLDIERRLPAPRAVGILRQICKALGAAHEKGIIHLDVKPDNVMLQADAKRQDAVKVVDFGIAGLLDHGGKEDRIAGTPEYIAPERARGAGYDHRSDVYSLGVLAYETLTGQVPFGGEDPGAVLERHVNATPRALRELRPELPARLEQVVLQMLAKAPEDRPQRMEVVEALLCEAQIEAGFETAWDDALALPAVDEEWRRKLTQRMPGRGGPRKQVLVAAVGAALVAAAAAVYLGVLRVPEQVVKVVRVPVTDTEEAESVAELLESADRAGRAQRFVRPRTDSALHFIERAEREAEAMGRTSLGAQSLRRAYASALAATGDELLGAGLRDLALLRFKDALAFRPDDPALARKAELTQVERQALGRRPPRAAREGSAAAPPPATPRDELREAAAAGFLAAQNERLSEARLALKKTVKLDGEGQVTAKLADALRTRAGEAWDRGDPSKGRALYQLVLLLDPEDLEARSRAQPPSAAPLAAAEAPALAEAPAPPEPPAPREAKAPTTRGTKPGEPAEDTRHVPRNPKAAAAAVRRGRAAMARGDLADAETAFSQAVRADPLDGAAVGGMAQVAFERARYVEALDFARRATRLAPKAAGGHLVLGDAYFRLLRFSEALNAYQTAEKLLGPKTPQVAARIERVKARLGP